MADLTSFAQPAVAAIENLSEKQLLEELGQRVHLLEEVPKTAGDFTKPKVSELPPEVKEKIKIETLGFSDFFRELGQKFFNRVNRQAFDLVCGAKAEDTEARESLMRALTSRETAATALTGLLITSLGMSPLLAPVVAVLAMKLVFNPAHGALCETWKGKLPRD